MPQVVGAVDPIDGRATNYRAVDDAAMTVVAPGQLDYEPETLPINPNGLVTPAGFSCPSDGRCSTPCMACRQARLAGWSFAGDVMLITPSWAGGDVTLKDPDTQAAARFLLRHEKPNGGGISFRFSGAGLDDLPTGLTGVEPASLTSEISTALFEIDLTQRLWVGDSSLVFGVGPRAAALEYVLGSTAVRRLTAGGLGANVTMDRPIWRLKNSEFSLVGFGRASFLAGDLEGEGNAVVGDGNLMVGEAGFGIEWRRPIRNGEFFFRYSEESQWWDSNMMQPISFSVSSFRLGYQW